MIIKGSKQNKNTNTLLLLTFLMLYICLSINSSSNARELNNAYAAPGLGYSDQRMMLSHTNNIKTEDRCVDNDNGFSIVIPSNWTSWSKCSFFTPIQGRAFPDLSRSTIYVRVTRMNLSSMPISSLQELANNVIFFTDKNFYKLSQSPTNIPLRNILDYGFKVNYEWNQTTSGTSSTFGPPRITLPFVNESSSFSTIPTGTAQSSSAATNATTPAATNATTPAATQPSSSSETLSQTPQSTIRQQIMAVYIMYKNQVYVIEYNAPLDKFSNYLSSIDEMINSFALVPPKGPVPR